MRLAEDSSVTMPFPSQALEHCSYFKGLVEAAPDSDSTIDIPHVDEGLLKFMVDFLEKHAGDEVVGEGWEKQKPRELTEWDTAQLQPIQGMRLVHLLKAANFIGCQLMLNLVAAYTGQILVSKTQQEVEQYFGKKAEWTPEQEAEVKRKYPTPFM